MQNFSDTGATEFTLNGIPFDKIFVAFPVGSTLVTVVCAYESKNVLLSPTPVTEFNVDGQTFTTQAELIAVLKSVVYNNEDTQAYAESNFLGTFNTYADFIAAHPTGDPGNYAFTLTNAAAEDGVFEYRWNPSSEAWELEPTPVAVQKKPFFLEDVPVSGKINLSNWEGAFYGTSSTPGTNNTFTTVVEKTGGFAKVIIDTTGKTGFPTLSSQWTPAPVQVKGADFEANKLFDLVIQFDGSEVSYFFAKRFV